MDHVGFDLEDRQNNEGKVVVGCNKYLFTWISRILSGWSCTTRIITIITSTHLRSGEGGRIRANCNFQVIIGVPGKGFVFMKTNNHPPDFSFDGW